MAALSLMVLFLVGLRTLAQTRARYRVTVLRMGPTADACLWLLLVVSSLALICRALSFVVWGTSAP